MIVKDGKVWFCLADACKALEIRNPRDVKKRLDSRGVDTIDVSTNSKNRHGEFTMMNPMTFIDEANLLPLHLPEQVGLKISRKVKARLDSRGVTSRGQRDSPAEIFKNIISNVTKNEEAGHGPVRVPLSRFLHLVIYSQCFAFAVTSFQLLACNLLGNMHC